MAYWKHILVAGIALAASVTLAQESAPGATRDAAPDPAGVQLVEVAGGFDRPLLVTHAGDGSGRVFVVEQSGGVWILQNGQRLETPFIDLGEVISQEVHRGGYSERGLLGMAFDPDYAQNGLFYVNYTDLNGDTVIAQFRVSDDPNAADPNSGKIVLMIDQPFPNHNGGHIEFGPDGYLYIAMGDGGSQNDPHENAQNLASLLGKILRIDVQDDGTYAIPPDNPASADPAFAPEVWAYGLRNPFRFSFDAATGDMYIGDVGGGAWEEVDFLPAGEGGYNFGWDAYEGNHVLEGDVPEDAVVFPVAEYGRSEGQTIIGGYVYRGEALPELQGAYFYSDWGSGTIWSLYRDGAGEWHANTFMQPGQSITSFGVDEQNELYLVGYDGTIWTFAPAA
jgi:glucose/arabinose dehydrogenase